MAAVVISTAEVPAGDRLDFWHDTVCNTLVPLRMSTDSADDYRGMLVHRDLGAAQLVDKTAHPLIVERTPRLIRASDPGVYKIELQLRGSSVLTQGDHETLLGPGQTAMVDTSRPYQMAAGCPSPTASSGIGPKGELPRLVALTLPRALLPVDEVAEVTAAELSQQIPTGRLIAATLAQLSSSAAAGDEATASRLVPVVLDLFAVGLAGLHDRTAALSPECRQGALLARIEAFIETHLADPELSPNTIAAAHHVSLRSLHQLFATHSATTVAAHIRRRRLERCRRALTDPLHQHRPVVAIAAEGGFTSLAHFTRLFRASYGQPPATYRKERTNGQPPTTQGSQ